MTIEERKALVFKLGIRVVNKAIDALSSKDIMDMHTCACYAHMIHPLDQNRNMSVVLPHKFIRSGKLFKSVIWN